MTPPPSTLAEPDTVEAEGSAFARAYSFCGATASNRARSAAVRRSICPRCSLDSALTNRSWTASRCGTEPLHATEVLREAAALPTDARCELRGPQPVPHGLVQGQEDLVVAEGERRVALHAACQSRPERLRRLDVAPPHAELLLRGQAP